MCAGAIIQSRIRKIYYGTKDLKTGAVGSVLLSFKLCAFAIIFPSFTITHPTGTSNFLYAFFASLVLPS